MGIVAVIGEEALVSGFGLAGAVVSPAADAAEARAAWRCLPAGATVVILTAAAAAALEPIRTPAAGPPFVVVMT